MARKIQVYGGPAAQQARVTMQRPAALPPAGDPGPAVARAVEQAVQVSERFARLHDAGVRQEVAVKEAELRASQEREMARRMALAPGHEESFYNADGTRNQDAVDAFMADWRQKNDEIARPYYLRENNVKASYDRELTNANVDAEVRLMMDKAEIQHVRNAFDTRLEMAELNEDWDSIGGILQEGVDAGLWTQNEADLRALRASKDRLKGLAARNEGQMVTEPIMLNGREYSGDSAEFAVVASADGDVGGFGLFPEDETVADSQALMHETDDGLVPAEADAETEQMVTGIVVNDAGRAVAGLSPGEVADVANALGNDIFVQQGVDESGHVSFDTRVSAPECVQRVAAGANKAGQMSENACRAMVTRIALDTIARNPHASADNIRSLFEKAGVFEAMGGGDAERGKLVVEAIAQDVRERWTGASNGVSMQTCARMIKQHIASGAVGKNGHWDQRRWEPYRQLDYVERYMPVDGDEWEWPADWHGQQAWNMGLRLWENDAYRRAFARDTKVTDDVDRDSDDYAVHAKAFVAWLRESKSPLMQRKAAAEAAAMDYYQGEFLRLSRENMTVKDGKLAIAGYGSEFQLMRDILKGDIPHDLGVEAMVEAAEARAKEDMVATDNFRALAKADYEKVSEMRTEREMAEQAEKHAKNEAEKRAKAEEKAAEVEAKRKLSVARATLVEDDWEWDASDLDGMSAPACKVPEHVRKRLVDELGADGTQVVYMEVGSKKIRVLNEPSTTGKLLLNTAAAKAVQPTPRKGERRRASGRLQYSFRFTNIDN